MKKLFLLLFGIVPLCAAGNYHSAPGEPTGLADPPALFQPWLASFDFASSLSLYADRTINVDKPKARGWVFYLAPGIAPDYATFFEQPYRYAQFAPKIDAGDLDDGDIEPLESDTIFAVEQNEEPSQNDENKTEKSRNEQKQAVKTVYAKPVLVIAATPIVKDELSELRPEKDAKLEPEYDMPVYRNKRVDAYLKLYTVKKRKALINGMKRSAKYMNMIRRIFTEHGLPMDLAYLAAVESNFNPKAVSRARATGLWQFMGPTGKRYKLNQSWFHDERLDPEKSTVAAAEYLKRLYNRFGHWELALAAYNSGAGRVRSAIRSAKRRGESIDYWSLRLPRETRGYVPAFMAVTIIYKNLEKFDFNPEIENQPEVPYQWATVPSGITIRQVTKVLDIKKSVIQELNPSLKRGLTPGSIKAYPLRVPLDVDLTPERLEKLQNQPAKKYWLVHRVRSGESLWRISRSYGIPVRQIVSFNKIRRVRTLRIGSKLMLPVPASYQPTVARKKLINTRGGNSKYVRHKVRKGDTLWEISQKYGVPVPALRRLNSGKSIRRFLRVGTVLNIKKKRST